MTIFFYMQQVVAQLLIIKLGKKIGRISCR